jgi:hypothetical protein
MPARFIEPMLPRETFRPGLDEGKILHRNLIELFFLSSRHRTRDDEKAARFVGHAP